MENTQASRLNTLFLLLLLAGVIACRSSGIHCYILLASLTMLHCITRLFQNETENVMANWSVREAACLTMYKSCAFQTRWVHVKCSITFVSRTPPPKNCLCQENIYRGFSNDQLSSFTTFVTSQIIVPKSVLLVAMMVDLDFRHRNISIQVYPLVSL